MEKTPMYAVLSPPGESKRQWVAWMAAFVSLIALVVSIVTACVAVQQLDRVTEMEEDMIKMRLQFEQVLQEFDYENYDYLDPKGVNFEELTLQSVVRKKREAEAEADSGNGQGGVPIYDQPYGVGLGKPGSFLRLYQSLQANASDGNNDPTSSPLKPHHRHNRLQNELDDTVDGKSKEQDAEIIGQAAHRRSAVLQRSSRVKATERASPTRSRQPVHKTQHVIQTVPEPVPQTVIQTPQRPEALNSRPLSKLRRQSGGGRKKRLRKKPSPRRRRISPALTVAHFVATPANRTAHHHAMSAEVHEEWTPAAWMDKLGLNRKYSLRRGVVTVKEAGLYYVYAQVLYQPGRFASGFQVVVDGIPIMECSLAPAQPSHSCHTGGASYLPRNAAVYIRDLEQHVTPVKSEENSFFGLVKLMDAPDTAEQLLLG